MKIHSHSLRVGLTVVSIIYLFSIQPASGIIRYVDAGNPTPAAPYTNWYTAAVTIQDAVAAAVGGDVVLVTNGMYDAGGDITPGFYLSNRVVITKDILVESLNGPDVTMILGSPDPETGGVGTNAMRGVYMNAGVLSGFTVSNGYTLIEGNIYTEMSGGGIWCTNDCMVTNCFIKGNTSSRSGGGVFCIGKGPFFTGCMMIGNSSGRNGGGVYCAGVGPLFTNCVMIGNSAERYCGGMDMGTAYNCTFINNSAEICGGVASIVYNSIIISNSAIEFGGSLGLLSNCVIQGNSAQNGGGNGGTAYNCLIIGNRADENGGGSYGRLYNCLVTGNWASSGGGTFGGTINNCTIVANTATNRGGGSHYSDLNNCIIYYNSAPVYTNAYNCVMRYSCSTEVIGHGNLTDPPQFVDVNTGNYHLKSTSPCINRGDKDYITWAWDFDGNKRVIGCAVDLGAYEYVLTGAWIKIIPESYDFGEVVIGEVKDMNIRVYNWGVAELVGYATNLVAPFKVMEGSPYKVSTCTWVNVLMGFEPESEGVFSNEVVLTGGGDRTLKLSGTGVPEPAWLFIIVAGIIGVWLKHLL